MKTTSLTVAAMLAAATVAQAFDITTCYQTVRRGEEGVLQADLACDGSGGPNVNVERGGKLFLNGHAIAGGYLGVGTGHGGGARAVIEGPGEITGASGEGTPYGCGISALAKTFIRNVSIRGNRCGISSYYEFSVTLEDVQVTENRDDGVSTVGFGPGGGRIKALDTTVSGNGGTGILSPSTVTGRNLTVVGNGAAGVSGKHLRLADSALSGNGAGGDVRSATRPHLRNSYCETSVNSADGTTWGVCSLD